MHLIAHLAVHLTNQMFVLRYAFKCKCIKFFYSNAQHSNAFVNKPGGQCSFFKEGALSQILLPATNIVVLIYIPFKFNDWII